MRKRMLFGFTFLVLSIGSFVRAQDSTPNIDPSNIKFLMPGCGADMWSQLNVMGVVAGDVDLSNDNTMQDVLKLALTFARQQCPGRKSFQLSVRLWRGDPATFSADRFNLKRYLVERDIGEAYKEFNDYGRGYNPARIAVQAFGTSDGTWSTNKAVTQNYAKEFKEQQVAAAAQKKIDDERRAKEQMAAAAREKEQQVAAVAQKKINDERSALAARRAQADAVAKAAELEAQRKIKVVFDQKVGKYELLTDSGTFCTNPFPWKSKIGASDVGYIRMIGEMDALFNLGACEIIVSGFPNAKAPASKGGLFGGYPLMFVAFRFLKLNNAMPVVQYVNAEPCKQNQCRDFR